MSRAAQFQAQREATDAAARSSFLAQASALRDNPVHRALFSLPPIRSSSETAIAVVEAPPQKIVTGDVEVDAVLWLREVISTGQADLIARAKEAASRIKTPLKELEKRYTDFLRRANPGSPFATFAAVGFDDLEGLAAKATTQATRRHEALDRFGDALFEDTPAEMFCTEALTGLRPKKKRMSLDDKQVDARFEIRTDVHPATLADCIYELTYWDELYWLRNAVDRNGGDDGMQVAARIDYVFRCLARIRPRNSEEAAVVLRHVFNHDRLTDKEIEAILFNLIGAPGGASKSKKGSAA